MSLSLLSLAPEPIQKLFGDVPMSKVRLNLASTAPLNGLYQYSIRSFERHITAIYTPPFNPPYWLLLTQREALLIRELTSAHWLEIPIAKGTGETRKPISRLREFGLVIGTKRTQSKDHNGERISLYRLLGEISLSPDQERLNGVLSLGDVFPDPQEASAMELERIAHQNRRRRASAKKKTKLIKRTSKK